MTTYKEIYGTNVEVLASDPTNPVEGQIWYNSTSQTLKGYALVAGSWATAGPLNTAREQLASAGIQTAALGFGGLTTVVVGNNESYNGTSWTTSPASLNTARRALGGAGTNTAALGFGGFTTANTAVNESYNGSTWTELGDLNTARRALGGAGTNTAALGFGGQTTVNVGNTETWNGTSWSEVNVLNTARGDLAGAGTNTAGLAFGGNPGGGVVASTEEWSGPAVQTVNITVS